MKKYLSTIVLLALFSGQIVAQSAPIGQWSSHLPLSNVIACVEVGDLIYAASGSALFTVNKKDGQMQVLSKVNGLSDVGIAAIRYSKETKTLVVAYNNANIDLIKNNIIYNIPDIKNKQITGSKTIYNVFCKNNYAYLASDLGIVVLDLIKNDIKDTYMVAETPAAAAVLDITISDTQIYAATNAGIYIAPLNGQLLNSFQSWNKIPYRTDKPFNLIAYFNNKLYANTHAGYDGDSMFSYDGSSWKYYAPPQQWMKKKLDVCYGKLVVVNRFQLQAYDNNDNEVVNTSPYDDVDTKDMYGGVIDEYGTAWIADNINGLIKSTPNIYFYPKYVPNSPASDAIFNITTAGNALWYTTGGADNSWTPVYHRKGIASLINNNWHSYTEYNTKAIDTTLDPLSICIDPTSENHAYVSTFGYGILEFKDGKCIQVFNNFNSSLQSGGRGYDRTCGLSFDNLGNLWATNMLSSKPLSVKMPDNTWTAFAVTPITSNDVISYLLIDDYNQKWLLLPRTSSKAVVVFNDNGTISDLSDDYSTTIPLSLDFEGSKELASPQCIAKDLDGNIWIGTERGVAVIYSPGILAKTTIIPSPQQVLIQQDGFAQYLLETDVVNSIAIDGANRKWFGTEKGGAFLFSPDGTKQLLHFTVDNSPLPDNNITNIAINNTTGDVFFGTQKGLVSYHGTATTTTDQVPSCYAYPNPVPHSYAGKIGIKGLASNSIVKITDVSGNLIYETPSEGGSAIWDGNTQNGRRVESGVYLVFSSNVKGEQTAVTKILFIK